MATRNMAVVNIKSCARPAKTLLLQRKGPAGRNPFFSDKFERKLQWCVSHIRSEVCK